MLDAKQKEKIDAIILKSNARVLVETAMEIAGEMIRRNKWGNVDDGASVSTSQIRNIFGSSKKIEMTLDESNAHQLYGKLVLLKPKMAYANGRFNKTLNNGQYKIPGFKTLVDSLSYAIEIVDGDYGRMKTFFNFFEAILAYHKAEGGK